ncbi:hypothetical protein T265_06680 [Opisthorchis viverrini]|uniref:Uncharacterized protein n=1 Tax=Opisthorchis viverrini TaxID=6198 RepID=A0A074ZJM0_OPIVI|nr:hypothetical protein T265_06680 [Opisthorchis viverrini]KER25987.1 hypothetical protein T265_06680 [Opisthorchis viverrini]
MLVAHFQLCSGHELSLTTTNSQHKRSDCVIWRPPTVNQPWTQFDHVSISDRWPVNKKHANPSSSVNYHSPAVSVRANPTTLEDVSRVRKLSVVIVIKDSNISVATGASLTAALHKVMNDSSSKFLRVAPQEKPTWPDRDACRFWWISSNLSKSLCGTSEDEPASTDVIKRRTITGELELEPWNIRTTLDRVDSDSHERQITLVAKRLERWCVDIAAWNVTRLVKHEKLETEAGQSTVDGTRVCILQCPKTFLQE